MEGRPREISSFADRRRLILGLRAAGLFLIAWGLAAPTMLVALMVGSVLDPRPQDLNWTNAGVLDRVLMTLGSKAVLLRWIEVGGMWLCALLLGWYLVTRDARFVVVFKRYAR